MNFNLELALNGEPIKLRNGQKAYIVGCIPNEHEPNFEHFYPLLGFSVNLDNLLVENSLAWTEDGTFNLNLDCPHPLDIVGMWYDLDSQEEVFKEAYAKDLVLTGYDSLNDTNIEVKLIGKTKGKNKGYIAQEEGTGVVELLENINVEHWILKDKVTETKPTNPLESHRFKPSYGDVYWYMTFDYGKPVVRQGIFQDTTADINRMEHNNCFNGSQELTEALKDLGFKLD